MINSMDLKQIEKELAEKIVDLTGFGGKLHVNDILPDIRSFSDRLVDEIEKAVVPEKKLHKEFECNGACGGRGCFESFCEDQNCSLFTGKYWNECRAKIQEAFTRFKGEIV